MSPGDALLKSLGLVVIGEYETQAVQLCCTHNPLPLALSKLRQDERPNAEWVGRIISRIGQAAGVIVDQGDAAVGRPKKYASAHDLRRSCAERLLDGEVPPATLCSVMRHASRDTTRRHYAPGKVQRNAGILRERLAPKPEQKELGRDLGTEARSV